MLIRAAVIVICLNFTEGGFYTVLLYWTRENEKIVNNVFKVIMFSFISVVDAHHSCLSKCYLSFDYPLTFYFQDIFH